MATSDTATAASIACPDCGGRTEPDGIETVCSECGLVVDEYAIDHGPDWRAFTAGEIREKERAKPGNRNKFDRGLGSEVGVGRMGGAGAARLRRTHKQTRMGRPERTRLWATMEITRMADALDVPGPDAEQAKQLFRALHDDGACRGRDLDTVSAACLYTALRVNQRGRTPGEVCEVSKGVDERTLARRHTWVCDEVGVPTPPPDPRQRIHVVAGKVDALSHGDVRAALDRLDAIDDVALSGLSPSGVAAALLYSVDDDVTQKEVADAADTTPTTLRKLVERLEL